MSQRELLFLDVLFASEVQTSWKQWNRQMTSNDFGRGVKESILQNQDQRYTHYNSEFLRLNFYMDSNLFRSICI
jgi:hypothetical protein